MLRPKVLSYKHLHPITGNPKVAISCFQEACHENYSLPSIWLRMAQCCVLVHAERQKEQSQGRVNELVDHISAGVGNWHDGARRWLLVAPSDVREYKSRNNNTSIGAATENDHTDASRGKKKSIDTSGQNKRSNQEEARSTDAAANSDDPSLQYALR